MEEATQSKLTTHSKNHFQVQNVEIKEEVVSDDEPSDDLQPISQVYLPEYQVKSEVDSTTLPVKQLEDKHEHTKTCFPCRLCKVEKMELRSFKAHLIKIHHLKSEEISKYIPEFYQCKYCQRQFKTPFKLQKHEGSHTLPFKCDICYKSFGLKSILKTHKLTHSEPQFPCPSCDKKFRRKIHLQYHIVECLHSGVVHKCDQCEKIFKCRSYLKKHIKFIHNKTNQSSWKCNECGRGFRHKPNLRRHIIYVHHTMSKNCICPYCSLKLKTSDNLKRHIKIKHNSVVPIESSDCSRKLRNRPKTFNDPISEPLGQILELQNQHTEEDDGPEIQPISEGNLPEYHGGNIKIVVNCPLESTMTDDVETIDKNDVQIKSEITIDEMECSMLKGSTEKAHSEGQCVSSQNETSAYTKDQVTMEGTTQYYKKELRIVLDLNEVKKYLQTQNVKIKDEVVSDLQPISQVYLPEYEEENIKTDVDSTSLAVMQLGDKCEVTKKLFSCSLCKKNNIKLKYFKQHLTFTHHLSNEEILKYVPEFYQCKYCHRRFKTPSLLHVHEVSHTLPFKCDICYKSFGLKSHLKTHKLTHSEPQHPCPHCDKKFRQKIHLTNHIESLHSGVVHKCDQCKQNYKCKRYLLQHIKYYHINRHQKSWKCDECGKGFKLKYNLKRHIIEVHHIISKSYLCPYCSVKFMSNDNLKHHIKTKHNGGIPIESNKRFLKSRNRPKTCIDSNSEGVSEPVEHLLTLQHQQIKEEISEEDGPEIQPISEVYMKDYHEENMRIEVYHPLESAMTDEVETTDENDVEIETEITIDEMDCSTLKTEESTEEGHSVSSLNGTSAYKQEQVTMEEVTQHNLNELRIILDSNENKNYFQKQNVEIKEEVDLDGPTDLQPIPENYAQEYQIKSEVSSTALPVEHHHEDTKKLFSCFLCKKNNMPLASFKLHLTQGHQLSKEEILKYVPEFYQCKYCHRQFKTPYKLQKHEGSHTLPFKCDICYRNFGLKSSLKSHKLTHSEPQIPCPHCDKKFRKIIYLTNHIESVHSGVVYECDQCEKKFKCRRYLLQHIRNHHSISHQSCWECDECGKSFKFKPNLKKHIVGVHLTMSKNYFCLYCTMKFNSNDTLTYHIKVKHNNGVPIESNNCSLKPRNCPKTFNNGTNSEGVSKPVGQLLELRNQHIKEEFSGDDGPEIQLISEGYLQDHHEENINTEVNSLLESTIRVKQHEDTKTLHSCSLCKKNNMSLVSFRLHLINAHRLNKEEIVKYVPEFYQCKYCHRRFRTPSLLQRHEDSHTLPFKCDQCHKRFGRKYHLKTHNLTYSEPQLQCPHCAKKFRQINDLKVHIESTHRDEVHKCDQCEKTFKCRSYLMKHIKCVHNRQKSWKCDECGKCFTLKDTLKRHIINVHHTMSNNYLCSYCSVKFKSNQSLNRHIKSKHSSGVPIESNNCSLKPRNHPKNCINPNAEVVSLPIGQLFMKLQNQPIKEEISEEHVPDIQLISQGCFPEYREENIKSEVNSPLDSTLNDTAENDIEIETEITIDEMDCSTLKIEENTEEAHSERHSVNLILDCINKNEILTKKQKQDEVETTDENNVKIKSEIAIDEMDCSTFKIEESTL